MEEGPQPSHALWFGPFEADLEAGQLRKNGVRVKLPQQPFPRIFNLMFYIPTFQRPSASLFIGARAR